MKLLDIKKIVNQRPQELSYLNSLELIKPQETLADWQIKKEDIQQKWLDFIGKPPFAPFFPKVKESNWEDRPNYKGRLVYVQTEPDYYEKTYLMVPKNIDKKRPAVLVYYYDIDTMIGENRGGKHFLDTPNRFFAKHLVERGYVVIIMRWFYQGYGQGDNYLEGVTRMKNLYPSLKGLSKVAFDSSRVLDYLTSLPFVDKDNIGAMGHSLGGKMGLYSAAFDDRIKASVLSELGIGLSFCNWDAPWYLGEEIKDPEFTLDHHQLLGLIAPRPLLLIAGDSADNDNSWHYIDAAKKVYALYGKDDDIGMYNHRSGHDPEKKALSIAYQWLDYYLLGNKNS